MPASTYEQIDKNLKDAFGYNAELGVRGNLFSNVQYDISYFRILYKNRMGTFILEDNAGQSYTYKTNVGNSLTNGTEIFIQYKFPVTNKLFAGLFTSTAYIDAHYISGQVSTGTGNKSIVGNKVESAPEWITRNGFEILYKGFSCTILYTYTSSTFSGPLNTLTPPENGATGFTPAYSTWDFDASLRTSSFSRSGQV